MAVEYYDSKRKALIKITRKGKPSKAKKNMYRKNRIQQLGQLQQRMMADLVFTRGMSRKDPDTAPIDQRERILAARENEKVMNANLQALTAAVKALVSEKTDSTGAAEKTFVEIATQSDLITTEDIMMMDRDNIGSKNFDDAVLHNTKKERLKLLASENRSFDIFSGDRIKPKAVKNILGLNTTDINTIYDWVSSNQGRDTFPILGQYKFLRESFSPEDEATRSNLTEKEIQYFSDSLVIQEQAHVNREDLASNQQDEIRRERDRQRKRHART
jgi:hypothetical protein